MDRREFIKNASRIKTDCFAWHKDLLDCKALDDVYCKNGECSFYKTEKERCASCRKAVGRALRCEECRKKGLK